MEKLKKYIEETYSEILLAFSFNKMVPQAPWCAFIATLDKKKKLKGINGYSYSTKEKMLVTMREDFDVESVEKAINNSNKLSTSQSDYITINNIAEYKLLVKTLCELVNKALLN